jgi:hypothetical protein
MIFFLCSAINLQRITFSNPVESVQSILSISVFSVLGLSPLALIIFFAKNLDKIKDPETYSHFHSKWGAFWDGVSTDKLS